MVLSLRLVGAVGARCAYSHWAHSIARPLTQYLWILSKALWSPYYLLALIS